MCAKRNAAKLRKLLAVLSSFFFLLTFAGCSFWSANAFSMQDFVMDTILTQTVYGKNAEKSSQEVLALLKESDKRLSAFNSESEIAKINSANGNEIVVSKETFEIIKKSLEYSRNSDGTFDITVLPISKIWKNAIESGTLPSENEVKEALKLVDFESVSLNEKNTSVLLPENMGIDLGAVAKGAVMNSVYDIYEKNGVSGAICSLGSSAMLLYKNKNGKPFKIGLRNPFEGGETELFAHLSLENYVVSSSGGYERYAEIDGEKYHHIIDLKTGYPAKSTVASATVVGSDGGECDYLSTRLFLLGFDKAKETCQKENIAAVLVSSEKEVFVSKALADRTEIIDKNFERIN